MRIRTTSNLYARQVDARRWCIPSLAPTDMSVVAPAKPSVAPAAAALKPKPPTSAAVAEEKKKPEEKKKADETKAEEKKAAPEAADEHAASASNKKKRKSTAPHMASEAVSAMDGGKRDPPLVLSDGIRASISAGEARKVKRDLSAFTRQTLNGVARDLLRDAVGYAHGRRLTPKMLSASIATSAQLNQDWCAPVLVPDAKKAEAEEEDDEEDEDMVDESALIAEENAADGLSAAAEGPNAFVFAEGLRGTPSSVLKKMAAAAQETGDRYTALYKKHLEEQEAARKTVREQHKDELASVGQTIPVDLGADDRKKETLRRAQAMAKHMRKLKTKKFTSQRAAELLGLRTNLANTVVLVRSVIKDASRAACAAMAGALDALLATIGAAIRSSDIKRVKYAKKKDAAPAEGKAAEAKKPKNPKNPKKKKKARVEGDEEVKCGLISYEHFVTGLIQRKRLASEKAKTVYQDGYRTRSRFSVEYKIADVDLLRLVVPFMPLERHLLTAIAAHEPVAEIYHASDRPSLI